MIEIERKWRRKRDIEGDRIAGTKKEGGEIRKSDRKRERHTNRQKDKTQQYKDRERHSDVNA